MSTELETKPLDKVDTDACWPPLAHIVEGDAKEGDLALCGYKIMGVMMDDATKVCKKCVKIWQGMNS